MGEISAKHLRGDSMADVIFNGSSARKPVGTASIELVFDNSDGTLGGEYASYAEVSLKRVVARDGTSDLPASTARACRRKDITQLFLGTGLGSRSYAIIEQGMISRLIEAKPDELRAFLEEAAGISKYKERRRETENRIGAHAREPGAAQRPARRSRKTDPPPAAPGRDRAALPGAEGRGAQAASGSCWRCACATWMPRSRRARRAP